MSDPARPVLWIDITELFDQFAASSSPSGISRVVIGLADALRRDPGPAFSAARLVFWNPVARYALTSADATLATLADFMPHLRAQYAKAGIAAPGPLRQPLKGLYTAIPKTLRYRLFPWGNGVTQFARHARSAAIATGPAAFGADDVLFMPGSFWLGGYAPALARTAQASGARIAAYVHDLMVLTDPQWWGPRDNAQFRAGADKLLPLCSAIACNSRHTLEALRAEVAIDPTATLAVCRLADLWDEPGSNDAAASLPAGPYALYVSTLGARKNHLLLVEAWARLRTMREGPLPTLVFAGAGAPAGALAEAIARARAAGVTIMHLPGLGDEAIDLLYRGAWITLFPSLGEGYGLPVAEALARGKACLASLAGGVAEIAPGLVEPIDPHDPQALASRIAALIDAPALITEIEAEIAARYRPTRWEDTARCVLDALAAPAG